jgi:hypothetical protein
LSEDFGYYFFRENIVKKIAIIGLILVIPALPFSSVMLPTDDPYVGIGLSDNAVIDIVAHGGAIWLATGRGVSFLYFDDSIWNKYDQTNGLITDNISAIYSSGDRLWLAMNHYDEGDDFATSDGLAYTYDMGFTWDTLTPEGSYGFGRTIFDIDGIDSLVFCASWYGGLVASFDNGQDWKHIFFNREDSVSYVDPDSPPTLSNLYFAVAADTLHPDSLVLWAGSAAGIKRFVYAPPYAKPSSNYVDDITTAFDFVYVCGDSGLTRFGYDSIDVNVIYGPRFHSSFIDDGLPGRAVTTAFGFGDRLFVGTLDSRGGVSGALAISDDSGLTFHTDYSGLDELNDDNKYPLEFASAGHHLFMAANEGGLYMSLDTGLNWQKVILDTLEQSLASGRNIAHTVAADSFDVWVGTDSGIVHLTIDDLGSVLFRQYTVFPDDNTTGARSYKVAVQEYRDTLGVVDSIAIWSLNHPVNTMLGEYSVHYSMDTGATWVSTWNATGFPQGVPEFDIGFINEIIYLVGENKFTQSLNKTSWFQASGGVINDYVQGEAVSFSGLDLNAFLPVEDSIIYVGSEHGIAVSPPSTGVLQWHILIANTDPTHYDAAARFGHPYLSGDFANVLDVQPLPDGESLIWASTHPVNDTLQRDGFSVSTLDGLNWEKRYIGARAWNFDFKDEMVFAATSAGLIYSSDTGRTWDTLSEISGRLVTTDPPVNFTFDPEKMVTAVRVVSDTLWIGREDGAAKIALSELAETGWIIYRVDTSPGVYAYPVPFSRALDGRVYFHYKVPQDAYATIEVYDFAMDLVKTVTDHQFRGAGTYSVSDFWDGQRNNVDNVAVGMYYFKVSLSTGEIYWGKLMIVP